MTKTLTTQVEENGILVELQLDSNFLDFYKRETGHSRITKKGVTRFLQRLINFYKRDFIQYY